MVVFTSRTTGLNAKIAAYLKPVEEYHKKCSNSELKKKVSQVHGQCTKMIREMSDRKEVSLEKLDEMTKGKEWQQVDPKVKSKVDHLRSAVIGYTDALQEVKNGNDPGGLINNFFGNKKEVKVIDLLKSDFDVQLREILQQEKPKEGWGANLYGFCKGYADMVLGAVDKGDDAVQEKLEEVREGLYELVSSKAEIGLMGVKPGFILDSGEESTLKKDLEGIMPSIIPKFAKKKIVNSFQEGVGKLLAPKGRIKLLNELLGTVNKLLKEHVRHELSTDEKKALGKKGFSKKQIQEIEKRGQLFDASKLESLDGKNVTKEYKAKVHKKFSKFISKIVIKSGNKKLSKKASNSLFYSVLEKLDLGFRSGMQSILSQVIYLVLHLSDGLAVSKDQKAMSKSEGELTHWMQSWWRDPTAALVDKCGYKLQLKDICEALGLDKLFDQISEQEELFLYRVIYMICDVEIGAILNADDSPALKVDNRIVELETEEIPQVEKQLSDLNLQKKGLGVPKKGGLLIEQKENKAQLTALLKKSERWKALIGNFTLKLGVVNTKIKRLNDELDKLQEQLKLPPKSSLGVDTEGFIERNLQLMSKEKRAEWERGKLKGHEEIKRKIKLVKTVVRSQNSLKDYWEKRIDSKTTEHTKIQEDQKKVKGKLILIKNAIQSLPSPIAVDPKKRAKLEKKIVKAENKLDGLKIEHKKLIEDQSNVRDLESVIENKHEISRYAQLGKDIKKLDGEIEKLHKRFATVERNDKKTKEVKKAELTRILNEVKKKQSNQVNLKRKLTRSLKKGGYLNDLVKKESEVSKLEEEYKKIVFTEQGLLLYMKGQKLKEGSREQKTVKNLQLENEKLKNGKKLELDKAKKELVTEKKEAQKKIKKFQYSQHLKELNRSEKALFERVNDSETFSEDEVKMIVTDKKEVLKDQDSVQKNWGSLLDPVLSLRKGATRELGKALLGSGFFGDKLGGMVEGAYELAEKEIPDILDNVDINAVASPVLEGWDKWVRG